MKVESNFKVEENFGKKIKFQFFYEERNFDSISEETK